MQNSNTCFFKVFGLPKAVVRQKLSHYADQQLVSLSFVTDYYEDTTIKIVFPSEASRAVVDAVFNDIYTVFGENLYADSNISLAAQLVTICRLRKIKLSVAESITGGAIASEIISIDGASKIFYEGIVCYDDESKIKRLNVSQKQISAFGSVSHEVCYEMALGLLNSKSCDTCIATTGIAGPSGGSMMKPVGLTYTAIGDKSAVHIHKNIFTGTRNEIRQKVVFDALYQMWLNIKYKQ